MTRGMARIPDATLTLVGDGPLREPLAALAADLGITPEFRGILPSAQVKEEMARARVFCLPSITASHGDAEGFGMVLLEAQACGVPVVTSAFGGAEEGLLHGKTGYRVAEKDVAGLADRLIALLADDRSAMTMSGAARDFVVAHFDIRRCTSELERYYDGVTGAAHDSDR
jgi:glycosyltransferase involved in cell wall biosynthesis